MGVSPKLIPYELSLTVNSEPNLTAGFGLRLAVGSESYWDLPYLCYQAYSFIGRPIRVGLLPLYPPRARIVLGAWA